MMSVCLAIHDKNFNVAIFSETMLSKILQLFNNNKKDVIFSHFECELTVFGLLV